jgi:mannose-6-phosphate isomerase-like protein (cupin superfamily)
VVTGHTPGGEAVVVSDGEVASIPIGALGSATTLIWNRDDPGNFPDDGSQPVMTSAFPPPGGCSSAVMELAPDGDEFNEFVRSARAPWADPDVPGMHRTATMDYEVVLEGTIGLELDNGAEVILNPGDVVVQNGTRHRWHNRGNTVARLLVVTVGAYQGTEGGRPVGNGQWAVHSPLR